MLTIQFWKDALERALKSAAQFAVVALGGNITDFWSLDWKAVLGVVLSGTLLSVLTSVASGALPVGSDGTASLTKAVQPAPAELTQHNGNIE